MIPVDFVPEARLDFDESFDRYAERSEMAANRFSIAVDAALDRIAAKPDQFSAIDTRHRECLVKRFLFRIVYRIEPHRIVVVAVAHAKRRPRFWTDRV